MRLLVVDDAPDIATLLKLAFQMDGYAVDTALSGEQALELATVHEYDVLILDLTLPDRDGIDVCRRLRAEQPRLLIIMLTARTTKDEIIIGLDAGADDYLTKPFDYEELVARVRALLRRRHEGRTPLLTLDDLTVDPATRRVTRGERRIDLTARQYALLEYFLRNIGRVLSRQMIAQHVWGLGFDAESNVIDVYVGYLRRKIDRERERRLLHTVRGAGYVLQVEE